MNYKQFRTGDIVVITSNGNSYTNWTEMADSLGLKRYGKPEDIETDRLPRNSNHYEIIGIRQHPDQRNTLFGIRKLTGHPIDHIINEKGIRFVERPIKNALPEDLFTL